MTSFILSYDILHIGSLFEKVLIMKKKPSNLILLINLGMISAS
jgi:hypothetical protein